MLVANKISAKDAAGYIVFQIIGAIIGSGILFLLAQNSGSTTTLTGANGFTDLTQAFIAEAVFTFIFLLVVFGSTSKGAHNNFAGLAIGLSLVLIHIVCIPITGTSVNPARSIGPAIFEGGTALSQLWLFIVAPSIGAILAAFAWKAIDTEE